MAPVRASRPPVKAALRPVDGLEWMGMYRELRVEEHDRLSAAGLSDLERLVVERPLVDRDSAT